MRRIACTLRSARACWNRSKAVEAVAPVHKKQLLPYLKLADKRLGLLINFNVALIKDGITRIVNELKE